MKRHKAAKGRFRRAFLALLGRSSPDDADQAVDPAVGVSRATLTAPHHDPTTGTSVQSFRRDAATSSAPAVVAGTALNGMGSTEPQAWALQSPASHGAAAGKAHGVRAPLGIFWDIENCALPSDAAADNVAQSLRRALRMNPATQNMFIAELSAYGDFNMFPRRIREGCQRTGINLLDVPNGRKDAADKAILADLFLFALDHPPPAAILLISGDVDFATSLHKLGQRGYSIFLAVPGHASVSRCLTSAALHVWEWGSLARGEGLQPVPSTSASCHHGGVPAGPTAALPAAGQTALRKGKETARDPSAAADARSAGFKDASPDGDTDSESSFNILDQSLLSSDWTDSGEEAWSPTASGTDQDVAHHQVLAGEGDCAGEGNADRATEDSPDEESAVPPRSGVDPRVPSRMFASNRQGDLEVLRSQLCHIVRLNGGRVGLVNVPSEYRKVFGTPFYLSDYGASKIAHVISRMKGALQVEGTGTRKWLVLGGTAGEGGSASGSDSDGSSMCGRRGYTASQCWGCAICAEVDPVSVEHLNASNLFAEETANAGSGLGGCNLLVGEEEAPLAHEPQAALPEHSSGCGEALSALAQPPAWRHSGPAAQAEGNDPAHHRAQVVRTQDSALSTNPLAHAELPLVYPRGLQLHSAAVESVSAYRGEAKPSDAQLRPNGALSRTLLDQASTGQGSEGCHGALNLDSASYPMSQASSVSAVASLAAWSADSMGVVPRAPRSPRTEPLAVFWDIENCCLPSDVSAESVGVNVRLALREHESTANCPITVFSAYGDFSLLPRRIREGCQRTGINLHDIPNGRKDAADKAILADLFLFALDHPPPASILLITSDVDFATALQKLSQRRYRIFLAVLSNGIVSRYLTSAADHVWDWRLMAQGRGAVRADPVSSRDDRARLGGMWGRGTVARQEDEGDSCSPCDSSSGSEASGLVSEHSTPDAEDDESWDDSFHQLYS